MNKNYSETGISLPMGEMESRPINKKEVNSKFLSYVKEELLKKGKLSVQPSLKKHYPFRFKTDDKELFQSIQKELKKLNVSFSEVYRQYYRDYIKENKL